MDANSTKVTTGKVRFCYAKVFEAVAMNEGEEPKYSVCIIIPKDDEVTLAKIDKAVKAAIEFGKSKLTDRNGKIPGNLKTPLRDGDIDRADDPAFENAYFLNASTSRKPAIVNRALDPIMDRDEFYSGCYGRASINFYAYNSNGNKGIAAGLNNLQKLSDGEPLAGGSTPEDDFGGSNAYDDDDMM